MADWARPYYPHCPPLLISQPQFADKCHCWDEIVDEDALRLIRERSELRARFPETRLRELDKLEEIRRSEEKGHFPIIAEVDEIE